MIASRKHGFIFIKAMKTAGTSIEMALSPHCGPDDVVAPIGTRFDLLRFRSPASCPGILPMRFASRDVVAPSTRATRNCSRVSCVRSGKTVVAHALPPAIIASVPDLWERAFRFTSERHPYEKAISRARFRYKSEAGAFSDHLERIVFGDRKYAGHPYYIRDGVLLVHGFIRYETLQEDYDGVARRFGIEPVNLPRARHVEYERVPARDVLTPPQRAFIYEQCAPEFELLGWER